MDYTQRMPAPGGFLPVTDADLAPVPSAPLFGGDPDQAALLRVCAKYNELQEERCREIDQMATVEEQLAAFQTLSEDVQARLQAWAVAEDGAVMPEAGDG